MKIQYIIKEAKYYRKVNGLPRAVKKFILTQSPCSKIVNTPYYNKYYKKVINKKAEKIKPTILQIENTNICNAKCVMCPHSIMKRRQKIMKQEEFEKIFDNVMRSYKIKRVTITGFGEPLIDRCLAEKIAYTNRKYPKVKIDLYTNASLMTKEISEKLLKLKIDRITFSINGTSKNYKKVMGLDYEKTKNNVSYFLKMKRKLKNPILTNVSLMILKENEDDVKKFIDFWDQLADSVRVYAPSDWAGMVKNIIQKNPFKTKKRWPCFVLWNNITVDVEGNVVLCCRDYESKGKFGNLLIKDAKEIRDDKKFRGLLNKQLNFDFNIAVCSTCDNSLDSSIDWAI